MERPQSFTRGTGRSPRLQTLLVTLFTVGLVVLPACSSSPRKADEAIGQSGGSSAVPGDHLQGSDDNEGGDQDVPRGKGERPSEKGSGSTNLPGTPGPGPGAADPRRDDGGEGDTGGSDSGDDTAADQRQGSDKRFPAPVDEPRQHSGDDRHKGTDTDDPPSGDHVPPPPRSASDPFPPGAEPPQNHRVAEPSGEGDCGGLEQRDRTCSSAIESMFPISGPDADTELEAVVRTVSDGEERTLGPGSVQGFLDGGKSVLTQKPEGDSSHLWIQSMDGSETKQLTDGQVIDGLADTAPDQTIAFVRGAVTPGDRNFDIYAMKADGSDVQRLTDDTATDTLPAWSPAGDRIAFASNRSGDFDIYVMDADGGKVRLLTESKANDSFPTWSPDGKEIVYASDRDGDFEIYAMNSDGKDVRRLTKNETDDFSPAWSSEGIAFTRQKGDQSEIYLLDADAVDDAKADPRVQKERLTTNAVDDVLPTWSANGGLIAFTRIDERTAAKSN